MELEAKMKRRRIQSFAAILTLSMSLAAMGCAYKYQFNTGLPPSGTKVSVTRHISMWGNVPAEPFNLEEACPKGVAEFGSYITFVNWLPALLSIGLYTPRTVYAVCTQPEQGGSP